MDTSFESALSLFGDSLACRVQVNSENDIELTRIESGAYDLISIPEGVTTVKSKCAVACSIQSLHIPNTVQLIQTRAFETPEFTELTFEDGDTPLRLEHYAFTVGNIKEIKVPDRLTTFGKQTYPRLHEKDGTEMRFIGGKNQKDLDMGILGAFDIIDLRKCEKITDIHIKIIKPIPRKYSGYLQQKSILLSESFKLKQKKFIENELIPLKEYYTRGPNGAPESGFNF